MSLTYAKAGTPASREPDGQDIGGPRPGATVSLTAAGSSVNAALPLDAAGKPYSACLVLASATGMSAAFCTAGGDAVVAGTSPAFLVPTAGYTLIGIPIGATNIAVIGTGTVTVIGVY